MTRPPLLLSQRQIAGLGLAPPLRPVNAPVLRPGLGDAPPGYPEPGGGSEWGCNAAQRVQLAGGALNSLMVHPTIEPFEQLYRRLPEEGMFLDTVSPETPFAFEMGAFQVPNDFALLLFDLRPDIYRFSGIDPGDTVPVEARRFSSIMGFEVTVDQQHAGNLLFQIDPVPIQTFPQAFTPARFGEIPAGQLGARLNITAASSFANAAGAGQSLLPQRPTRYGPLSVPFTLYARSGQTVQLRCIVFRQLTSPIAFIEFDMAGILMPELWLTSMIECSKPMDFASGGPGSLSSGPR
jgi:hypothetical protein